MRLFQVLLTSIVLCSQLVSLIRATTPKSTNFNPLNLDYKFPVQMPKLQQIKHALQHHLNKAKETMAHLMKNAFSIVKSIPKKIFAKSHNSLPDFDFISMPNGGHIETLLQESEDIKTPLSWANKGASESEIELVLEIRLLIKQNRPNFYSRWIDELQDEEILRFLRSKQNHISAAYEMILNHDRWRVSEFGAESAFTNTVFENSPLRQEIFWLGRDSNGCPTLVIRTEVHNGLYYNEDPKIFTSFLSLIMEQGRREFGVGINTQFCILLDRSSIVRQNGVKKIESLDMSVLTKLAELFNNILSTMNDNYPDIFHSAMVVPTSWFFNICYSVTSNILSPSYREKIYMISSDEIKSKIHPLFTLDLLPKHLGGKNSFYTTEVDIYFDPTIHGFGKNHTYFNSNNQVNIVKPISPTTITSVQSIIS